MDLSSIPRLLNGSAVQATITISTRIVSMPSHKTSHVRSVFVTPLTVLIATALIVLLNACTSVPSRINRSSLPESSDTASATVLTPAQVELVFHSITLLGVPYRNGGTSPNNGFDCSGLVRYVFSKAVGLNLPHNSEELGRLGESLAVEQLQAGDLVFYNTQGKTNSHVGIYLGEGRFIHAPSERGVVRIENMTLPYWTKRYDGARRLAM